MPEESVLAGAIRFMDRLGVYDVVLPFLLVFTIMYAILEKSKILGTEKWGKDGEEVTRKNLNAMLSFTVAFLVVASSKLVEVITAVSAKMVVLLFLVVFFLLLVGAFYGKSEEVKLEGGWRKFFFVILFMGIALIFLDAVPLGNTTMLSGLWNFVSQFWTSAAVASLIFVLLLIGFMYYITTPPSPAGNGGNNEEEE